MVQIVATPDQARILAESSDSVEIVDANGNRLGIVARSFSRPDIESAIARLNGSEPRRTTEQILERLLRRRA